MSPRTSATGKRRELGGGQGLTRRGSRFSCTPYYPRAPDPPNPVPPVPASATPQSTQTPHLVKKYAGQSSGDVPIWKSIQYMDHEGMDLLRAPARDGAVEEWEAYLARTKVRSTLHYRPTQNTPQLLLLAEDTLTLQNTICGRNPITVLLNLLQYEYAGKASAENVRFNFVRYEQSSQCTSGRDSSVSYVSGILTP